MSDHSHIFLLGIKQQHFHIPPGSSTKVNFLKDDIVGQSKSAKTLVKIHGEYILKLKSKSFFKEVCSFPKTVL